MVSPFLLGSFVRFGSRESEPDGSGEVPLPCALRAVLCSRELGVVSAAALALERLRGSSVGRHVALTQLVRRSVGLFTDVFLLR